jgi:hypothetical protein
VFLFKIMTGTWLIMPTKSSNLLVYSILTSHFSNMINLVGGGLQLEGGLYCFELCHPRGYYWGDASNRERASIGGNTVYIAYSG